MHAVQHPRPEDPVRVAALDEVAIRRRRGRLPAGHVLEEEGEKVTVESPTTERGTRSGCDLVAVVGLVLRPLGAVEVCVYPSTEDFDV
jgi:hypothetical protein